MPNEQYWWSNYEPPQHPWRDRPAPPRLMSTTELGRAIVGDYVAAFDATGLLERVDWAAYQNAEEVATLFRVNEVTDGVECPVCKRPHSLIMQRSSVFHPRGRFFCLACETNIVQCIDCAEWRDNNAGYQNYDGFRCLPCHEAAYPFVCDNCGEHVSDVRYHDGEGADLCESCYDDADERYEDERTSRVIHDYSYKPRPVFLGKGPLFFGIELEVEAVRDNYVGEVAESFVESVDADCYLKHDGSLSNGFEIVTHPMSYNYLLSNFPFAAVNDLRKTCRSGNTDTCGMHVHMSKDAFTNFHLYKWLRWHYDNPRLIKLVAQRSSSYATLNVDTSPDTLRRYAEKKDYNYDRYVAVNLQNADTIECRYFRGNLRADRIRKNIEFLQASFDFTKWASLFGKRMDRRMTEDNFFKWLADKRQVFPNLIAFFAEKDYPPTIPDEPDFTDGDDS